jgi:signal transduction histidine kinase
MIKSENNLRTAYLSSILFLMLILLFAFLSLHKYAYNFEKTHIELESIIKLNTTINNFSKEFNASNSDSTVTEIDFIKTTLIPSLKEEVSNPLKIKDAIIIVTLSRTKKVVAASENVEDGKWEKTLITSKFSLFTDQKGTCYTCYYYIPDIRMIVFSRLKGEMTFTILLILVFLSFFIFIIRRWIYSHKASLLKDDFFQNITHELKTPIATTSIATDIFKKFEFNLPIEKTKEYINIITEENRKMKQIVDRLLSISIVDNSASKMSVSEVDINDLILRITKNLHFVVTEKGGSIEEHYNAQDAIIIGDQSFITMIFTNLLDNAIKYSPKAPKITITTSSNDKGVTISITDNGIGIPDEALTKIFYKTYRIKNGHNIKGFGLGLYFVKQLVEIHKGKITVNSTVGKGSEFSVFLPFNTKK